MFVSGETDRPTPRLKLQGTLWHCEKCGSVISIYAARIVQELPCPICMSDLEFCAAFDGGFGQVFGDA
jgi:hypothetical protein